MARISIFRVVVVGSSPNSEIPPVLYFGMVKNLIWIRLLGENVYNSMCMYRVTPSLYPKCLSRFYIVVFIILIPPHAQITLRVLETFNLRYRARECANYMVNARHLTKLYI